MGRMFASRGRKRPIVVPKRIAPSERL
jgi:hypothetical protein